MVEVREKPRIPVPNIMDKIREIERGFELARIPERLSDLESRVGLNVDIVTSLENQYNLLVNMPVDIQKLKDMDLDLTGRIENVKSLLSQYVNVSDFRPTLEALIPDTTFDSGLVTYTDYFQGAKLKDRRLVDVLHTLSTVLGNTLKYANDNYQRIKDTRTDMTEFFSVKGHLHDLYSKATHLHDDLYAQAAHLHDIYSLADHVHAFEDVISDLPDLIVSYGAGGNFKTLFDGRMTDTFLSYFNLVFPNSFATALDGVFPTLFDERFFQRMDSDLPNYFKDLLGSMLLEQMGGFPSGQTVEQYLMDLYERMAEKMDITNLSSMFFDDALINLKKRIPGGLTEITASLKDILDQHNLGLGDYKELFTGKTAALRGIVKGLKDEMAKYTEAFNEVKKQFSRIQKDFGKLPDVFGDLAHAYHERFITNPAAGFGIIKEIFQKFSGGGSIRIEVKDHLGSEIWVGNMWNFNGVKAAFESIKAQFESVATSSFNIQDSSNFLFNQGTSFLDW